MKGERKSNRQRKEEENRVVIRARNRRKDSARMHGRYVKEGTQTKPILPLVYVYTPEFCTHIFPSGIPLFCFCTTILSRGKGSDITCD